MCAQTGNELDSPPTEWTCAVAQYIKVKKRGTTCDWPTPQSIHNTPASTPAHTRTHITQALDPNHLVIDGRQGVDPGVLDCPHVDVVSKHYYPAGDGRRFRECLREDLKVCAGRRPFFIGEFGFAMLSSTEVSRSVSQS